MSDDELIEMRQAPPRPLAPKVESLTSRPVPPIPAPDVVRIATTKAPPKPTPNVYAVGGMSEGETRAFIAVSWIVSLILAFFVGGALL
jgi:hypothetical protein